MKQKVTITLTIDPADYGAKGTAQGAVEVCMAVVRNQRLLKSGTRVRFQSRRHVRYQTPLS